MSLMLCGAALSLWTGTAAQPPSVACAAQVQPGAPAATGTASPAFDVGERLVALVAAIPREKSYGTVWAAQLQQELAGAAPFLVDVRDPQELAADGHIPGAVHIPLRSLIAGQNRLPSPDRPIVVYCGSSQRDAIAMLALRLLGYADVRNLAFGFEAWWKAGLPVAQGAPLPAPVLGAASAAKAHPLLARLTDLFDSLPTDLHATTARALHTDLAAHREPFLIDVRRAAQYQGEGHLPGAVSLPFETLFSSLGSLPSRETRMVIYCASGHRSSVAAAGLRLLGYRNVTSLDGGLTAWMAAGLPLEAAGPTDDR